MACPLIIFLQNCYITKQTFQQKSNLGCKIYFASILIVLGKMRNCVMQKVNVEKKCGPTVIGTQVRPSYCSYHAVYYTPCVWVQW